MELRFGYRFYVKVERGGCTSDWVLFVVDLTRDPKMSESRTANKQLPRTVHDKVPSHIRQRVAAKLRH